MNKLLTCPVCLDQYNSSANRPISTKCGHTVCNICIKRVNNCPSCRNGIKNDPLVVNYALLAIVSAQEDATIEQDNAAATIEQDNAAAIIEQDNAAAIIEQDNAAAIIEQDNAAAIIEQDNAAAIIGQDNAIRTANTPRARAIPISPQYVKINTPSAADKERCKVEIANCFGHGYFDRFNEEMKALLITNMWYQLSIRNLHLDEKRKTIGGSSYKGGRRLPFSSTGEALDRVRSPVEIFMDFVTDGNNYSSVNIVPIPNALVNLSTDRTFDQLHTLCKKYMSYNFRANEFQIDSRLAKFIQILPNIDNFIEALNLCQRPVFWEKAIAWLEYLHNANMQLNTRSWETATTYQKNTLRLIALIGPSMEVTGDVAIIRGFETGESLINFSANTTNVQKLAAMMDSISNPAMYQVSQVAQALVNHNVSLEGKLLYISLMWRDYSDLDIALRLPDGTLIYYGKLESNGIQLNFDANANCMQRMSDTPVEFISSKKDIVPPFGNYEVLVNCYKFKNGNQKKIPFTLTITVGGVTTTYEHVWDKGAGIASNGGTCYQKLTISPESFAQSAVVPAISDSKARSISANTPKFKEHYGANPSSKIVNLSDAPRDVERLWLYNSGSIIDGIIGSSRGIIDSLLGVTKKASVLVTVPLESYMSELSESADIRIQLFKCGGLPTYATQIVCDLECNPLGAFNFNVLHEATSQIFLQPNTTLPNTGRLSPEWVQRCTSEINEIKIIAIVKWRDNYFCIVDGAMLPNGMPVTGGFYPSDLPLDQYAIRTEYSIFNTVRPEMPSTNDIPMIGFWIHKKHTTDGIFSVKVDGEDVNLIL